MTIGLSACVSTRQVADSGFKPPKGDYRLIVMQPDISVGVLTAGGSFEHREDWTKQARSNVPKALSAQQRKRGGNTTIAATREAAGGDAQMVSDLYWLHTAIGRSIRIHKYSPMALPTKKDKFDWTLGMDAVAYGAQTNYDYALFLYAQDSFASGGRVALQVASALGCGLGFCVVQQGGQQQAFASLVDLKSGQIVWFNTLAATTGDIRTPEGASKMVDELLEAMEPGST
jgi:hypothetical protein